MAERLTRDELAAAPRRASSRQPEGRWPLVMPNAHVRRIVDRNATLLVLTRELAPDTYEIHDAQTIRKNRERSRDRRPDLQESSLAFTIEVLTVEQRPLTAIQLPHARAAGFKTTEELHTDWCARRGDGALDLVVTLHTFEIVTARYLHKLVHRGYTTDPAHAAEDEPQALGSDELEDIATANRERYRAEHAADIAKREARSLANQLKEAQNRAVLRGIDVTPEISAIREQLDQIQNKLGAAA